MSFWKTKINIEIDYLSFKFSENLISKSKF